MPPMPPIAAHRARSSVTPAQGEVRRGRGRAPAGPEAHAAIRQRLLNATRAVFSRVGYHGLTVELVLAEAGLSRPTFYKHFRNTDEPIDIVIADVNDQLIANLLASFVGHTDPFAAVDAGLLAWRAWGEALGPMLVPLFAELHDARSPASAHRKRTLSVLHDHLLRVTETFGRARPTRLQVDALLNGVEYVGYRFHLETARDDVSWKQTRDAMLRIALATLGNASEWQHAMRLAQALDIDLNPRDPD